MPCLRILAVTIAIALPGLAMAESGPHPGPRPGPLAACQSDVKALCGSVQPGGGRIRDCMREHRAQLSTACKLAIAERMLERGPRPNGMGPGNNPRPSDNGGPAGGPGAVKIVR
jgi:hypothetical protein